MVVDSAANSDAIRPRSNRPRWHLLYFVLAGFDLLTISISLFLNHRLAGVYAESVRVNQEWAGRLARYSRLGEVANTVNATANDVFETRDVALESRKMRESLADFDRQLAGARADIDSNVPVGQASLLLEYLDSIRSTMTSQVGEGEQVFAFFGQGQFTEAGERMARLDRHHSRLNAELARLRGEVARIQMTHFQKQTEIAATLRVYEYFIGGAIVLMVLGVALYGYKLSQQLTAAAQVKERQLAVIAQIATGVAHELRNPLTSIKMLVQQNRMEAENRGVPVEDLTIIEQEIRRMERCLQSFLDFARPPTPERRLFDLVSLVTRSFTLIEGRAAKQQVKLEAKTPSRPVLVEADWEQIQQLLLNLVLNALDAMPTGGRLEIEIPDQANGQIELRVLDTGPGISPQVMPKLFEPFVTGKETGVGLGLVVSRRIAEDHGGSLNADNRADAGACFVLKLPVPRKDESNETLT